MPTIRLPKPERGHDAVPVLLPVAKGSRRRDHQGACSALVSHSDDEEVVVADANADGPNVLGRLHSSEGAMARPAARSQPRQTNVMRWPLRHRSASAA
jgi:hypothetical protein